MSNWRKFAFDWLPPAVLRISRKIVQGVHGNIRFEGDFFSWKDASSHCTGYDARNILEKVLEATLKVKAGEAVFERDSVLFDKIEYSWPLLTGLMWTAARNHGRINVLDFGGALGSSYLQNRMFLKTLPEVVWHVVEQPHYVKAGRMHFQDRSLQFHETIRECLIESQPNVVLLSGVLQCLPNPYSCLSELLAIEANTVILDRTPYLNHGDREKIKIQHVPESIYAATYPCHFFLERKMRDFITSHGYRLVEEFEALDTLDPIATWKGHIFERAAGAK